MVGARFHGAELIELTVIEGSAVIDLGAPFAVEEEGHLGRSGHDMCGLRPVDLTEALRIGGVVMLVITVVDGPRSGVDSGDRARLTIAEVEVAGVGA